MCLWHVVSLKRRFQNQIASLIFFEKIKIIMFNTCLALVILVCLNKTYLKLDPFK